MGFFDKLGEKANEAYSATAEKTTKLAKEAKLRIKINEDKSEISDLYKEIGKIVYEKKHEHESEEKVCLKKELENEFTRIDVLKAEIEEKSKEILELNDKKKCVKCSAHIEKDAKFCNECGEKQPEDVIKDVEVISVEENQEEQPEEKSEQKQPEDIIIESEEKKDE